MICPVSSDDCATALRCAQRCRCYPPAPAPLPLDFVLDGAKPLLHFVGFRLSPAIELQRYENATRVFGPPDVVHRIWDTRAQREIPLNWDVIVFAPDIDELSPPSPYTWDDSNEPDDPAARERT